MHALSPLDSARGLSLPNGLSNGHPPRVFALATLCLAGALVHAASGPADYPIQLSRNPVVGEHYRVVANATNDDSVAVTVDGREMPPRGLQFAVGLIDEYEVLALTPGGRGAKARLVIEKFVRTAAGQPTELLPAGTVLIAERVGDKTVITMEGMPVAPALANALQLAGVTMSSDVDATDQIIFGTNERKKVGDSWSVNAAAAATDLARRGLVADASNVTGTSTLVEVLNQQNEPLLRVTAVFSITGVTPPLPPGMAVQSAEMTAGSSDLFPVDPTKHVAQESTTLSLTLAASGTNNGQAMALSITKKTSRETKFTRL